MRHFPFVTSAARTTLCLSIGLLLGLPAVVSADPLPVAPPDASRAAASPRLAVPPPEPQSGGSSLVNPFTSGKAAVPNVTGQTLAAPVTVNANTSSDAMTVNQAGTGRAISGVISNAKSTISALKGTTNGSAAALAGQNTGTTGPAGQFQVTNTSSDQAGLVSSTTGMGSAIQAIQGNTGSFDTPAIVGQHISGPERRGIGVEGDGNYIGVKGFAVGKGGGIGVSGYSSVGYGVEGLSSTGPGVYGYSNEGYGVYGESSTGYAGFFAGNVWSTGVITARSYASVSDRNMKEAIQPVDGEGVLDRIAALPISSWDFQTQPGIHHIGPMAQDFRAAFGLGADDRHIDMVDGIGVSLAAIQELQRQVKAKDAALLEQRARIDALEAAMEARFAALEQRPANAANASVRP